MTPRRFLRAALIFAAGAVAIAAVGAGLYLTRGGAARPDGQEMAAKRLSKPGEVPIGGPFTLVDQDGNTVTNEDFGGRYLLVYFGYTHCPDICPTSLNDVARTLDLLGDDAGAVQPLFISVDPDRDTPASLARYVKAFHPRLVGLTGTPDQVAKVAKEYRVFYNKVAPQDYNGGSPSGANGDHKHPVTGDDYYMSHSSNVYLMTPDSRYLTHFDYGTPPKKMAATVRAALATYGRPAGAGS